MVGTGVVSRAGPLPSQYEYPPAVRARITLTPDAAVTRATKLD